MKHILPVLFSGLLFLNAHQPRVLTAENQNSSPPADSIPVVITSPPASLALDPFYRKYTDANGFPVISSWRVPDKALLKARAIIIFMTDNLPDAVVDKMRETGVRVGVMARCEASSRHEPV